MLRSGLLIVTCLLALLSPLEAAPAEETALAQAHQGVRHILFATFVAKPGFAPEAAKDGKQEQPSQTRLWLKIRVSDHALEADFFGVVAGEFTDADLGPPAVEKTIWQAARCHSNRGFPKMTVIGIEGAVSKGQERQSIAALPRRIGKMMPADEIMLNKPVRPVPAGLANEIAVRAETKLSGVAFELRLKAVGCEL